MNNVRQQDFIDRIRFILASAGVRNVDANEVFALMVARGQWVEGCIVDLRNMWAAVSTLEGKA